MYLNNNNNMKPRLVCPNLLVRGFQIYAYYLKVKILSFKVNDNHYSAPSHIAFLILICLDILLDVLLLNIMIWSANPAV